MSDIRGPFVYFSTSAFSSLSNPFNLYERKHSYVFAQTYMFYIHSTEIHQAIPILRNFILIYSIPYHSNQSLALLLSWIFLGAYRKRASEGPYFLLRNSCCYVVSYYVPTLYTSTLFLTISTDMFLMKYFQSLFKYLNAKWKNYGGWNQCNEHEICASSVFLE